MRPPATQHQTEGIAWLQKTGRALLGDDPGTGKTRQLIEAADGGRTLVVAPAMVIAGGTWSTEIEKWSNHSSLFHVVPYSMLNRRNKGVPVKALRDDVKGRWDTLIVDEAHYVKGRSTLWTWATLEIAKSSEAMYAATGTPIPNWAHELFTILQLIHGGTRGGEYGSFWRWAEKWFDCKPTRFSRGMPSAGPLLGCQSTRRACNARPATDPCEHYRDFAAANLAGHYLRRTREQCLDLPPVTDTTIQVPMTDTTRKAYRDLRNEFCTMVGDNEVISWSNGSRLQNLELLAVSPWFLGRGDKEPSGGKLDRLAFDLSLRTRPTLVLGNRRRVVEACCRVAQNLGLRAEYIHGGTPTQSAGEILRRWHNGMVDVLVGSIARLAEGLTLTEADCAIFVQESWQTYKNEQAMRRIHRMGQTHPVTILRYRTPASVDTARARLLALKTDQQIRHLTAAEMVSYLE